MFVVSLPRCLQICVSLTMVSRLQGRVSAPIRVEAPVEQPFTLSCTLVKARGESVHQIRFDVKSKHKYSLLFWKNTLVISEGNKTAVGGKQASLACRYGLPEKVKQVLWKKIVNKAESREVASFAKQSDPVIEEEFVDRASLSLSLSDTQLTLWPVRAEDEACYTCEFHTYPDGTKSAISCLTIFVLPKPQVSYKTTSPGVIEANCTAVARPQAEIVWNVEGNNRTIGSPVTTSIQQSDGTTLVISTLTIQAGLLKDVSVKCLVHHKGLETAIAVSMNTKNILLTVSNFATTCQLAVIRVLVDCLLNIF
uniref:Zgc:113337 n=1 Tax=Sinocyclocheilus rhinocerous TaxID=307959 RepID=A0A673JNN4_9TELE